MFGTAAALAVLWVFYASGGLPKLIGMIVMFPFKVWDYIDEKISRK